MERYSKMSKYAGNNLLGVPTIEDPRSLDRLEKALTGQKDADLLILSNLDDETLLSFCLANRSANLLCKDESFWRNRFIKKYGMPPFTVSNWRRVYLKSVYNTNKHIDYNQSYFLNDYPLYLAAKNKDYELVHLILFLDKTKLTRLAIFYGVRGAIDAHDFGLVELLMGTEEFPEDDLNHFLRFAAAGEDLTLIDYFIKKGATNIITAVNAAIGSGNLNIVKYLVNKITTMSPNILDEFLKYSLKHGTRGISEYFQSLKI
jgi:hypothetical protein